MPERHVLYQYASCPFCHRVRQFLESQGIDVELRDTLGDPAARRELVLGGGQGMVPCLRIERAGEVRWLYESMDIIDYLRRYHADESATVSNHQAGGNS
ncbi:MAG: glutaredoxin [Pseudomonadales bacterium]